MPAMSQEARGPFADETAEPHRLLEPHSSAYRQWFPGPRPVPYVVHGEWRVSTAFKVQRGDIRHSATIPRPKFPGKK
jgi:hypothetical protein